MAKWLNATVCKTVIRGFESRSRLQRKEILYLLNFIFLCYNKFSLRALSSFGRAPVLHSGGERFESARVHGFLLLIFSYIYSILILVVLRLKRV